MGHLLAVLVMYYHLEANVLAGLGENPTSAQVSQGLDDARVPWTVAVVCFVFDFIGLFGGLSIFFRSLNLIQSVLHFMGALYTCWFVLYTWNYEAYWRICGLFSILPALLELGVILNIFVFNTPSFHSSS